MSDSVNCNMLLLNSAIRLKVSFLQEMYTQAGPQLRDELQRHHLPTYMVSFFFDHLFFPPFPFCYKDAFSPLFLISFMIRKCLNAYSLILLQIK